MSKNSNFSANPEFDLVAPVKILVKPVSGYSDAGAETPASSLRRRSIPRDNGDIGGPSGESGNVFLISGINQVNGLRSEASVEIEDNGGVKNVAYYMEHCFRLMYLTGMSTYNPGKNDNDEKTMMDIILSYVQKILFWTVSLVSIGFAAISLKHKCLAFSIDRGVPKIVQVGSWFFTIVSEIYYMFLFSFGHKRINKTIGSLRKIRTNSIEKVGTKKWKCHNPRKLITTLFVVSMLACFMQPMAGFGVEGWSPKKLILNSSTKLANKLFIWSTDDYDIDATTTVIIREKYGTELTSLTVMMGLAEITMRYCSNLKMDTALNLSIVVAILVFLRNRDFAKKVKLPQKYHTSDAEELDSPNGLYAEFTQVVRMENKVLNGLMDGLLRIIHGYSVLQGATFFLRCLDNGATLTEFAFLVYDLSKVTIMYYFGKKAEAENKVYEQWIIYWAMHSKDPVFLARAPVILHEMTAEPIGLGEGKFLVGQGFIFRFLGFVGSIFMLEVDDDDDEN